MRVISIINQKGGVAKTTTSINLSAYLGSMGYKTLLIDLDPQGNATSGLGIDRFTIDKCIYNALINKDPLAEITIHTKFSNLDLIPATIQLAGAEIEMVSMLNREYLLKTLIKSLNAHINYDYIIIDCPPSLGLLTLNALTSSDQYIVPIQCEYYALEGLGQLINTTNLVRDNLNPDLNMLGALLTMYNPSTNLANEVVMEVKSHFKEKTFNTLIPRNVRLSEAPSHGEPISAFSPDSKGAIAYENFTKEVLSRA